MIRKLPKNSSGKMNISGSSWIISAGRASPIVLSVSPNDAGPSIAS